MKYICLIIGFLIFISPCFANDGLRKMFLNNEAIICAINIRNFNSKDINNNDIIDENEERGNFINAIERLDEIKSQGINTLHVLPITPVGKLKSLGTAGSLYAISDFLSIRITFAPPFAANLAAVEPAGPAPITNTSVLIIIINSNKIQ